MISRTKSNRAATTACPSCKTPNGATLLFCRHCRYPLAVKRLSDLSLQEMSCALDSLKQVMTLLPSNAWNDPELEALYERFWNMYWLRPERALLRFSEAALLRTLIKTKVFAPPFVDLGCGDGWFTALLWGTQAPAEWDNFSSLDLDKADCFDNAVSASAFKGVEHRPVEAHGVDFKANSVNRARSLGFYQDVKQGDLRNLPWTTNSMPCAFSNMLDDIRQNDVSTVLGEAHRILKRGGRLIFTSPTEHFRSLLFYGPSKARALKMGKAEAARLFDSLDRGRSAWESRSSQFWKDHLKDAGFELTQVIPYAGRPLIQMWDTGFRPFFATFVKLRDALQQAGLLAEAKGVVVNILKSHFRPYAEIKPLAASAPASFALMVARKKG